MYSEEQVISIAEMAAQRAVQLFAEQTGCTTLKYIYRPEMIERIGRSTLDKGIRTGKLKVIKQGGKTSKVKALRTEFEKFEAKSILS